MKRSNIRNINNLKPLANKKRFKYSFWISAGIFAVVYIFFTLQTVSSGGKLALLEKEENNIVVRNKEMSELLMRSTSLTQLEEKTLHLGYIKPEKIIYISEDETVAQLR